MHAYCDIYIYWDTYAYYENQASFKTYASVIVQAWSNKYDVNSLWGLHLRKDFGYAMRVVCLVILNIESSILIFHSYID